MRKSSCNIIRRVLVVVPLMVLIGERVISSTRIINVFQLPPLRPSSLSISSTTAAKQPSIPSIEKFQASRSRIQFPSLEELTTRNRSTTCSNEQNFTWITNRISNATTTTTTTTTTILTTTNTSKNYRVSVDSPRIPRIIHQTSKSRCLTKGLAKSVEQWNPMIEQGGWSYFFHDDQAMEELFSFDYPEFPHLKLVTKHCLHYGTVKADLWRYLVLYVYGGLYADLDTHPNYKKFQATSSIQPDMEGFFVVEQYHILSQYFMAMAPRHPLMYYAIQHSLLNIYNLVNTRDVYAPSLTGPHALHEAYRDYRRDAGDEVTPLGQGYKPVWRGTFIGTHNTTITVVGHGEKEAEWVIRESLRIHLKRAEYSLMGMRHFKDDLKEQQQQHQNENQTSTGISCIRAMLPQP